MPAEERIAWLQIYADSLQYGIEREQRESERLQAKLTSLELLDEAVRGTTQKVRPVCSACNRDLSDTTNSEDYRLHLSSEAIHSSHTVQTDVAAYEDIDSDKFFCGLKCLRKWLGGVP